MLRVSPTSALPCWRTCAGTVWGTKPVSAGAANARDAPTNACSPASSTMLRLPANTTPVVALCASALTQSAVISTCLRGRRSATTPPTGSSTSMAADCAARTRPRSPTRPVACSTANASPTGAIAVPSSDAVRAPSSSRKSRARSGAKATASMSQMVPATALELERVCLSRQDADESGSNAPTTSRTVPRGERPACGAPRALDDSRVGVMLTGW